MEFKFNTIEEVLEDIALGKMVIVVDDPDRENEGDLGNFMVSFFSALYTELEMKKLMKSRSCLLNKHTKRAFWMNFGKR